MELNFLLSAEKNKTFAHYTLNRQFAESAKYKYSGFYYIGKNSANIEKLVKIFKSGYVSDAIENAKNELKRSLLLEKNTVPEVIICESRFDLAAIKHFSGFLDNHEVLSSIPFVLDASNLDEKELAACKKNRVSDEIIFLDQADEKTLLKKTQFLLKVKTKSGVLKATAVSEPGAFASFNLPIFLKRVFDILVSSVALLLLSPLFLLIALAIRLESKGPVFYISKRAGRGYKIFNFYKFRTMKVGADKFINEFSHLNQYNVGNGIAGPVFFKINNDPRTTKVGAFLRKLSLDELPQLLNVFLGDMSLVGNRPLPLYEAATLTTDECAQRFLAPAGITGLWQIKKRGKENMSVEERISLDIDYANKYNFMYDLWIMANTPSALLQKENV